MPKPLAIIPTYVRQATDVLMLEATLRTLRETAGDACDVLVVDDGSPETDLVKGIGVHCESFGAEFVAKPRNEGFSRTVNVGLRKCLLEGRDAILVNSDIEFGLTRDWLGLMERQARRDSPELASIVGALLVYPSGLVQHGGIYFSLLTRDFGHRFQYGPGNLPEAQVATVCPVTGALQFIRHECLDQVGLYDESFCSPADEPVLTSREGYVPIGELEEGRHGLVTVDHSAAGGRIVRGRRAGRGGAAALGGRAFRRSEHRFQGELIVIATENASARVTPGHRLRARWTEEALASCAVYLMRRGNDWRIGVAQMATRTARTFGPRVRQGMEGADALWILRLCRDRLEAVLQESAWSVDYGIPQTLFRAKENTKRAQPSLDEFWSARNSAPGALRLLLDHGLDPRYPLLGSGGGYMGGAYHGFLTHAVNLLAGYTRVGVDPGVGTAQARELVSSVHREPFDGVVYGLDVPPHHYYVSGGIVVHNSLGWEDVDYCVRTWLSGRECVYQPGIRAVHHESAFRGGQRADKKMQRWTHESWMRFIGKYADVSFAEFVPNMLS